MAWNGLSRREVSLCAGSLIAVAGAVPGATAATNSPKDFSPNGEISHSSASIHQEVGFPANSARIYRVLTQAELFDRVVQLSAAMNSNMKNALGSAPTQIDAQPGGAFALFGGYITGRTLELVEDTRIVQAWRAASWEPDAWSIAQFVLLPQSNGTRLVLDHRGFPDAAAAELAKGWHVNYWEPLAKSLS